jgi:hypothetical protein
LNHEEHEEHEQERKKPEVAFGRGNAFGRREPHIRRLVCFSSASSFFVFFVSFVVQSFLFSFEPTDSQPA